MYGGMTGRLLEREVFGDISVAWEGKMQYLPYQEAMHFCHNHQPENWSPTEPSPRVASDLHALVAIGLEEIIGEFEWNELGIFSAIGTPLDVFHGVDGWFEFHGRVVTFDLTTNSQKGTYKADVILIYEEDNSDKITLKGAERIPFLLLKSAA
jgi:hypothetical protein